MSKARLWDVRDHLATEEMREAYLEAALEEGDPDFIPQVAEDIEASRILWIRRSLVHEMWRKRGGRL